MYIKDWIGISMKMKVKDVKLDTSFIIDNCIYKKMGSYQYKFIRHIKDKDKFKSVIGDIFSLYNHDERECIIVNYKNFERYKYEDEI